MTLGSINHQHGAGLVTSAWSNTSRRILCPLHGVGRVPTNKSSSGRSTQVSVAIALAAAAYGAKRDSEPQQQQQQAAGTQNDLAGLVLSSKHNAPMHPGLLAQVQKKQRKARGGYKKLVVSRTLPETAKQKKKATAKRQVKLRQPAAPAMDVHPAGQASSGNVQQPRSRGRPPKAVQNMPAGVSAASAAAAINGGHPAGPASSSNVQQPRRRGRPPKTVQHTPAEDYAAAAAAAINGGRPAGPASSSNVQQSRRRSRPLRSAHNTPGEGSAAAQAAATINGVHQASTAAMDADSSSITAPSLQQHRRRGRPPSLLKAQQQLAGTTKQQTAGTAQPSLMSSRLLLAGHSKQHHAQQQQQQQQQRPDARQLPDQGQPVVDSDTNSNDSFLADGGGVPSSSDLVLDSLLDTSSGDTSSITDQQRVEMERLFGLSTAPLPGMSPWSATTTAAFDSSDEGGNSCLSLPPQLQHHHHHQQQQQQPEQALQQQQQHQQPVLGPKGFKLTSVMLGKSPYVKWPSQQQQEREQDDATVRDFSNISSSDSIAADADDHDDVAAAGSGQQLGLASPLEPSPLEPLHPEMHCDVQLQEEQNRLQGHRHLLHEVKQGAALYQQYLSNPFARSLAFLTTETLQALNTARQFVQQHPELAIYVTAGQQELDRALQASRKAAESLRNAQELIIGLERILQQEEQRAGNLVNSSSKEQTSQAVDRSPAFSNYDSTDEGSAAHNEAGPAGAALASAPAAAVGGSVAASDDSTRRASESLDMLQRLLPQLESAGTLPPQPPAPPQEPGGDADPDADIDHKWG